MKHLEVDKPEDAERLFNEAERHEDKGHFTRAFRCLLRGARLDHTGSQTQLGNFYSRGRGANQNLVRAAYWYKRAYRNGDSIGALNLAINKKLAGNTRSAIVWFRKAAALNDGDATIELARIYMATRTGKPLAIELLKRTQSMNCDAISEDSKEEALVLLSELAAIQKPKPQIVKRPGAKV